MRPSLNRSPTVLPNVNQRFNRGRNQNGTSPLKIDTSLPTLSKESFTSLVRKRQGRKKDSLTMLDHINSISNFKMIENDNDTTYNESPTREILRFADSPTRLRKTGMDEMRNPSKASIDDIEKTKFRQQRSPNIDTYLDYLGTSLKENLDSFSSKLREKHIVPKDEANSSKENSAIMERPGLEDILPAHLKTPIRDTFELGKSRLIGSTHLDLSPTLPRQSLKLLPLEELDSPVQLNLDAPKRSNLLINNGDGKSQEKIAMELAEETAANYRLYTENTLKNRDLQEKMLTILTEEGALPVFYGRVHKQFPLHLRIFKDLTEQVDIDTPSPKKQKGNGSPSFTPSIRKQLVSKKTLPVLLIVPSKYKAYKAINDYLLKMNKKMKVQVLQALGGKLIQAHDDFTRKKKEVLGAVSRANNTKKYKDLKAQCDGIENSLWPYEGYPMDDDFEADYLSSETMMINKGLETVMKTWKKNLIKKLVV